MSKASELVAVNAAEIDTLFDAALEAMALGDAWAAADHFEQVLTLNPAHEEAAHGLIRALEDSGRIEEALRFTEKLIASNPEDVLAVTRLSMLYQHKGMVPEAEAAATKAKILGWKLQLRDGTQARTDL